MRHVLPRRRIRIYLAVHGLDDGEQDRICEPLLVHLLFHLETVGIDIAVDAALHAVKNAAVLVVLVRRAFRSLSASSWWMPVN